VANCHVFDECSTNGSNTDWNTAGDWSPTGVPQATDDAFINSGIVSLTTGDTPIDVNSITLSSTGGAPLLEIQEPGQTQSVAGAIAIEGNSSLSLDGANIGGAGGSTLTIGGTLTNSSTNGNGLDIGNTGITAADTVTVNGTGGLVNSSGSQINIEGNTSVQATLNVANAPAGFGTDAGSDIGDVQPKLWGRCRFTAFGFVESVPI
jgi:hypothetical protein